jgi:hypothetical protein
MWNAVVKNAGLGTMARVDNTRRLYWKNWDYSSIRYNLIELFQRYG